MGKDHPNHFPYTHYDMERRVKGFGKYNQVLTKKLLNSISNQYLDGDCDECTLVRDSFCRSHNLSSMDSVGLETRIKQEFGDIRPTEIKVKNSAKEVFNNNEDFYWTTFGKRKHPPWDMHLTLPRRQVPESPDPSSKLTELSTTIRSQNQQLSEKNNYVKKLESKLAAMSKEIENFKARSMSKERSEQRLSHRSSFRSAKQELNNDSSDEHSKKSKKRKFRSPLLSQKKDDPEPPKKKARTNNSSKSDSKEKKVYNLHGLFGEENTIPEELNTLDPLLIEKIAHEVLDHGDKIYWKDICGLEKAKGAVQEAVIWPLMNPDLFSNQLRRPPKGLLLFGPPGTGKTLIAKAIANEANATFFSISSSSLMSKWIGEGENLVKCLFKVASYLYRHLGKPSIIFIDEIDSLLSKRGGDDSNSAPRRMKTEFLVQLDGAGTSSEDNIIILGATNLPWEIDEAVRRRLVKKLYIPLPSGEARKQLIMTLLNGSKGCSHTLTEDDVDAIVAKTNNYSGSDMTHLVSAAAMAPIREIRIKKAEDIRFIKEVRPITMSDFTKAFQEVKPSVDAEQLHKFETWNESFGSV